MSLSDLLETHDAGDSLRAVAEAVLQFIMGRGVTGAGRHERAEGGDDLPRNGRDRALDTRLGTLDRTCPNAARSMT